jgi:hypothetical protein
VYKRQMLPLVRVPFPKGVRDILFFERRPVKSKHACQSWNSHRTGESELRNMAYTK